MYVTESSKTSVGNHYNIPAIRRARRAGAGEGSATSPRKYARSSNLYQRHSTLVNTCPRVNDEKKKLQLLVAPQPRRRRVSSHKAPMGTPPPTGGEAPGDRALKGGDEGKVARSLTSPTKALYVGHRSTWTQGQGEDVKHQSQQPARPGLA
ncbi:hypothetical protein E2C01_010568 [Portunus trituberculatus]|uniref:Uncharacterized protein n=1 Tax=Portunus trituberculatus TaxID=210409 RepID=A0A5B7D8U1_PORTR|nr:hypothetical protein [Portunus trituberculatus]